MAAPVVFVQNQSTVLTDDQVKGVIPALQKQVDGDFSPVYLSACTLAFADKSQAVAGKSPALIVADTSDQAGALGYHELSSEVPIGFVFAADDLKAGLSWSVTMSHELLEMLADPYIDQVVLVEQSSGGRFFGGSHGILLAHEVGDAPEADQFGYLIDGVKVSDWVYPEWFNGNARSDGKYSFRGNCKAPQQVLPGGYIGVRQVGRLGQWSTVTGQRLLEQFPDLRQGPWQCLQQHGNGDLVPITPPKGSRRERRMRDERQSVLHAAAAAKMPTDIFGPVRNDLDVVVNQASASLAKLDNVTGLAAAALSNLTAGKTKLRLGLEFDPVGASFWLEPRS